VTAVVARLRRPWLTTEYEHGLRLLPTRATWCWAVVLAALWLVVPMQASDFTLTVLTLAGIFAVGGLGLNLLTGYTGQVSVGHAFFMGVGAYSAAHFGGDQGLPLWVWFPLAALIGGAIGGAVGPFALRLRGNYLAIVSVGLLFIGLHVWNNFESVTGGNDGVSAVPPMSLGSIDVNDLHLFGRVYSRYQTWFWFTWALVAVFALLCKNIVRSRPGRAMQAVRDRDAAAAVVGVNLARYKVGAFILSSALGALAGGLQFAYVQYASPGEWGLARSVQFIAIVVVGGAGTIYGPILGALLIGGLPNVVDRFVADVDFIADAGLTAPELSQLLYGLLLVGFLVLEPRGLAGVWVRIKAYFTSWPFSY
jgi:branched-chain amino acid transport system permease protein